VIVRARGLSKGYRQYARPIDSLKELLLRRSYHSDVWALRELDLELVEGQHLGVIGDNGAGKSTLLKLLAGTLLPSAGTLEVKGRVSAILELGTGFHPEFSGLDNVRMACSLRGMPAPDIDQRLPEIVDFSELGDAVRRPVKTYSSGMYVRLAFAVATAVDPEVLIVDEALSVGDQHFQKKSLDRIRRLIDAGSTLVFCSHNLYQVKSLCNKVLWLERGRARMLGAADQVVDAYLDSSRARDERLRREPGPAADAHSPARILEAQLSPSGSGQPPAFAPGVDLELRVRVASAQLGGADLTLAVVIMRNDDLHVYGTSTEIEAVPLSRIGPGELGKTLRFDDLQLLSGHYLFYLYLLDEAGIHIYDKQEGVLPFMVRHDSREVGVARLSHRWLEP
jgi:lipopolysaccharide transport system ATP-binding protein